MLYHPGRNPTVDCIVTRNSGNDSQSETQVLWIRRSVHALAEPGKWAFPGGFINTKARKNEKWISGEETEIAAVKRELVEETDLNLSHYSEEEFTLLGIYDNLERDPRNTAERWIESHVYSITIQKEEGNFVEGKDDAEDAKWFSLATILEMDKSQFAFDHYDLLLLYFGLN